jgi:hypothetical protein
MKEMCNLSPIDFDQFGHEHGGATRYLEEQMAANLTIIYLHFGISTRRRDNH